VLPVVLKTILTSAFLRFGQLRNIWQCQAASQSGLFRDSEITTGC